MVNMVRWRYSYGRQCYKNMFAKTEVVLPVTEAGDLDTKYMTTLVNNIAYCPLVKCVFEREAG